MRRFFLSMVALSSGLVSTAWATPPGGFVPPDADAVVARVYTNDPQRLDRLGQAHELWYYIWREGYAVIRTSRDRLPADAIIDEGATASFKKADSPFRGTGTIPARPCYRTVEQTYADLQALADAHPQLAQWIDFGDSWEKTQAAGGYDLQALVVTNSAIPGPKPVFVVMAASHARELATAESATRFAEMLFDGYGSDPDITWMLDFQEVHVIAVHNPDGRKMAEAECT
ncbi:MAG: M14 family zinc carboxypeptidase, partial [Xanthomonadales bacterium]|nr:M14 family zinc carboxypeptidase [Xanthomonadales bacterium]